ncbi:hypothetical protein MNBD_GAMMA23-2100 [hydrothermal vent metagenome]|uniref:Vitamin B12 ABC transporter, permease protein BtuC n=1 Tax=hydrothermal vent metagenome TaxID=652676 RepID=A0A3B1A099_9ZZZZ
MSILVIATIASLITALLVGSSSVSFNDVLHNIFNTQTSTQQLIVQLRLERALAAFVTGGLLALAGALMQVLIRNPLADPYILGISGGASVAALLAIMLGLPLVALTTSAFAGALFAMLLVFLLSRGLKNTHWNPTRLLLTGIILAAGWGAIISFILTFSPSNRVHSMLFWLMGDLSYSHLPTLGFVILLFGLLLSLLLARSLNVLIRGEQFAQSLGIATHQLQWKLLVLASLCTATAVTQAGSIGFIGLVVPHLIRLAGIQDHRILLPASVLCGGTLLTLADTLSRSLFSPIQIPVGIVTALIGIPLFLYLLQRSEAHR